MIRAKCFQDTLKNRVTFDLVEPTGRISSLFSITSKDNVETLQNLDFEDSPTQYQLNVIATEVETGLKSTSEVNYLFGYVFSLPEQSHVICYHIILQPR